MVEVLFWFSLSLVIYIYIGYPLCIALMSILVNKPVEKKQINTTVSILISAYNEEKFIARTIQNKLEQDYSDFEIIIISDGSTDNTDEIIQSFTDPRIKFIRQEPRQGKTAALNRAVSKARGDIIVFSDANSIYENNALKFLISNFADPRVGYVTGKMIYTNKDSSLISDGCDSYMRYENNIRKYETQFNSIVGVDGGIDAIRKDLFEPLNPDQLPDFAQPLHVIKKGYRVVYEPAALLREESLTEQSTEYRMRVRVSLRALWALLDMRALLNPIRFPIYSWQLLSHKVLRYIAWLPVAFILLSTPFLFGTGVIFKVLMLLQLLFYSCAVIGFQLRSSSNNPFLITAPYYFLLINTAAALAFIQFIRGKKQIMWVPRGG